MRYSELKDDFVKGRKPSNAKNYVRSGGNKQQYKWKIVLNNGKTKTVYADSRKNISQGLEVNDLIIGIKSAKRVQILRADQDKKEVFVGKLKDPAAQELSDIANELNQSASRGYSFNAYNADKELATIIGIPPGMDIETQESNMIGNIKGIISNSQHWTYKAFRGDVEEEFAVYVIRK
jgi:hypothetical protein